MPKRTKDETTRREPREDASQGPDETGIGAQSTSSPQGDGAEKSPRREGNGDALDGAPDRQA